MCVMFFNVDSVREYLLMYGFVYTLRKKRWRIGNDIAVKGSRYKRVTIAKIFIEKVGKITNAMQLWAYSTSSGVSGCSICDNGFESASCIAYRWFELGKKLSGDELYLYKISIRDVKK